MKSLQDRYPKRLDIPVLIVFSIVFLIVGLMLPILTVRRLWEVNTYSVVSGVQNLIDERYFALAIIIFFFSVVFPISKLIALSVIWFMKLKEDQRQKLLYFMEGKILCLPVRAAWPATGTMLPLAEIRAAPFNPLFSGFGFFSG